MFTEFLNTLKRHGNESLIEAIQDGYNAIFEAQDKLTFTVGNTKLGKKVQIFSLPAGSTCPGATSCKAEVKDKKVCDLKQYHRLSNLRVYDSKESDNKVKVHPRAKAIEDFEEYTPVGITDKPIKRIKDINNVEDKTITNIDGNEITFSSDVKTPLPANMNNEKSLDTDNPYFRCFAASEEATYPSAHKMRKRNYDIIRQTLKQKGSKAVAELINSSINKNVKEVRIHESGDFFGPKYLEAWIQVANDNPDMRFYAYTKSIDSYIKYKNTIPANFTLTGSMGGRGDKKILKHKIPYSKVFMNYQKAIDAGYPIDFNDEIAQTPPKDRIKKFGTPNFGLIIHGPQSEKTLGGKESKPNSAFLHGMMANKEGFGGTKKDMFAFNKKHKYANISSNGRPAIYGSLYDDWKIGWDQYLIQNKIKSKKSDV